MRRLGRPRKREKVEEVTIRKKETKKELHCNKDEGIKARWRFSFEQFTNVENEGVENIAQPSGDTHVEQITEEGGKSIDKEEWKWHGKS